MATLSELARSDDKLIHIKANRLVNGLSGLGISANEAEAAVSSPRVGRLLKRMSEGGSAESVRQKETADALLHELSVLQHLVGAAPGYLGNEQDDILTSDLDAEVLEFRVAPELSIKYLAEATSSSTAAVTGIMWGRFARPFMALAVSKRESTQAFEVPFMYDSESPITLLSKDTLQKLGHVESIPAETTVIINGTAMQVQLASQKRLEGINILGADFMGRARAVAELDYTMLTVKLRFKMLP